MKATGKITDISLDIGTGKPKITLLLNEKQAVLGALDEIKDIEKLSVELKKHRAGRSRNANDYLWALCTEIAENQGITPDEVYRKEIREAGVCASFATQSAIYERTAYEWGRKGLGWFTVKTDEANGWTYFIAYYGSSSYDTTEMSRLLEHTVEDARALGIDIATPRELSLLKESMK